MLVAARQLNPGCAFDPVQLVAPAVPNAEPGGNAVVSVICVPSGAPATNGKTEFALANLNDFLSLV
jgi:hypothetical protein